jgi:hypothetical protein
MTPKINPLASIRKTKFDCIDGLYKNSIMNNAKTLTDTNIILQKFSPLRPYVLICPSNKSQPEIACQWDPCLIMNDDPSYDKANSRVVDSV